MNLFQFSSEDCKKESNSHFKLNDSKHGYKQEITRKSAFQISNNLYVNNGEQNNQKQVLDQALQQNNIRITYTSSYKFNRHQITIGFQSIDFLPMHIFQNMSVYFNECKLIILDYSKETKMQTIADGILYGHNKIEKIILPCSLKKLLFKQEFKRQQRIYSKINLMVITSFQVIESIEIDFYSPIILLIDETNINYNFTDLTNFTNLKILKLRNILNDIKLPNQLIELELTQLVQFQHKILIFPNNLNFAKINNFEVEDIDFSQTKLELLKCQITNCTLSNDNNLQQLLEENCIENIVIKFQGEEICSLNANIVNIIFLNFNVKRLNILNTNQLAQFFIGNNEQIITDCSKLTQLKEFQICELTRQIVLPLQIQKIHIKNIQYSTQTLDFSQLVQLSKLEINNLNVSFLILPQYKKQKQRLVFSFNHQDENFICIETHILDQQRTFVDSLKCLKIKGLVNIFYTQNFDQNQDVFDLTIFRNLEKVDLINVNTKIKLPTSLVELYINISKQLNSFDFSLYEKLTKITLANCIIDKLESKINIFIQNCTINHLKTQFLEKIYCTKIKVYEPNLCQDCISTDETCIIQSILIHKNEKIKQLNLSGVRNIIFQDQKICEKELDLTHFNQLQEVYLKNISCENIVFGKSQNIIKILNSETKKMNKLDFSVCTQVKSAYIQGVQVNIVILTSPIIEFQQSNIKFLKLHNVEDIQLFDEINQFCTYTVYSSSALQYQDRIYGYMCNYKDVILSLRMSRIYENIYNIISE